MIEFHVRKGSLLAMKSDLIRSVESVAETLLTLTTGEKIFLQESVEEVKAKFLQYRKSLSHQEGRQWP